MTVDLSVLESYGRTAVHCTSKEQAELFMEAMWEQYPDKVRKVWRRGQTNWNEDRERKKSIFYLPRIVCKPGETTHCQSSYLNMFDKDEYTIIEFADLLREVDLGEIGTPEFSIESLFGTG